MRERSLELTIRLGGGEVEIDVYEPESGEVTQIQFPYSPDEHPELNEALGNEVYSWIGLWNEEEET